MTATAVECRANAMACLKQAEEETPPGRVTLLAIAQQWLRLATELENAETFMQVMDHIDKTWDHPMEHHKSNNK
jgi:hypothetical protein